MIMDRFFKYIGVLLLFALIGCKAAAQKFTTHAVKEGETLERIAMQYKVTPEIILTYNKEIKRGEDVKPNTILVIPMGIKVSERPSRLIRPNQKAVVEEQEPVQDPIGFTTHKVRRRETLFGISQRYHITEDDIKKYNTELYSSRLKKGMKLKIPKYKRVKPDGNVIDGDDFEIYTVAPKGNALEYCP